MVIKGYHRDGSWVYVEWALTFSMGWKPMVYAVNSILPAIQDCSVFSGKNGMPLDDFTDVINANNGNMVQAGLMRQDNDVLKVRGTISDVSIDITLHNQAEFMQLTFLNDGFFPDEDYIAIPWLYDVFGALLDRMEIVGHVNYAADVIKARQRSV
jgi:hypothetical protein